MKTRIDRPARSAVARRRRRRPARRAAAQAQFQERTLRLSVPVPKEHPQGNGVAKMSACTLEKSGGKLKIQPFYDGVARQRHRRHLRACAPARSTW